ncbi:1-propanol dehydrogenase PduQ [Clostridium lundense]|uniref:1-propanol dehydrogenase PduQ n=1 Tax=Clostridium lundense TaxID=319475 RepID=UPI000486494A|nr:1-propanol dehydrogenase PduQ [Clostridium lundense]
MNEFKVIPKIYFGQGSIEHLCDINASKVFIVTDPFIVQSNMILKITEKLDKSGITYKIFSDIVPDPPIETIAKGISAMSDFEPEAIITIGGGSSIDAAKGIKIFQYYIKDKIEKENKKKPIMIAIPTTSGTGSEVTNFSVITDKIKNIKYPLVEDSLTPDESIIDPDLVLTVPKGITADTGMDVLTHAIEAYVSTKASDYTDALAEKAIKIVFKYLIKAYKNGSDLEAREKMHNASCIAGMAFTNASLGLNHGMAHILGGKFHVPHGKANAILLPYVIEYNSQINNLRDNRSSSVVKTYAEISKFLGLSCYNDKEGVKSLISEIKNMLRTLNIPTRIKDLNIKEEEFLHEVKDMSKIAIEDRCNLTNPKVSTSEEVEKLFLKAYYGR